MRSPTQHRQLETSTTKSILATTKSIYIISWYVRVKGKMITLVMNGDGAGIWLATIIWYTCVVFPLRQIKQSVVRLLVYGCNMLYDHSKEDEVVVIDSLINIYSMTKPSLPEMRFEETEEEEEMCSICLVDFEKQHTVCQLARCKHVFHSHCINKWIERDEFTCPLCRSVLFHVDHVN